MSDNLMDKINQTVESGLLKLLSRGMVVVGLPIAAFVTNGIWDNINTQFDLLAATNKELRSEIVDLRYQVKNLNRELAELKANMLTPYGHALEHQQGIFRNFRGLDGNN